MAKKNEITLQGIKSEVATITIVGDSPLILNKMGKNTEAELMAKQENNKSFKKSTNEWIDVITSIHWEKPLGDLKENDYSEELLYKLLEENRPCISARGMKEQLAKAIVRFDIDQYSTKFKVALHILTGGSGLIPISFSTYELQKKLIPTKTLNRVPVLARLNTFYGWSADITFEYIDSVYSLNDITQIFYLCGKSLGIGSGTADDNGLFHVENVK